GSEAALAELLVGAAAEVGAEAQVGLAEGVLAAMLAAREQVHVPPGRSAEFLARRDVRDLVHVTTTRDSRARLVELVDLFRRLGLATLGDVARLRPAHVGPRFGALGLQAHRLAQGLDAQPPQVRRAEPDITVQADLDPPAHRVDAAAFAARRLAEELQTSMLRRGVVCARLRVHARTEDGGSLERIWRLDGGALAAGGVAVRAERAAAERPADLPRAGGRGGQPGRSGLRRAVGPARPGSGAGGSCGAAGAGPHRRRRRARARAAGRPLASRPG